MNAFARSLVALSLAMVLAAACGGREEETPDAGSPAASSESASSSNPLAHLTPEQLDDLARLREQYIAKSGGRAAKPAAKPRKPSDVVTIESTDGTSIELPDTFPADLPIFPGAVPTRHVTSPTIGTMTEFDSDDTVDNARRHYSNELGKSGWMLISDLSHEGISLIVAEKDGRELSIAITQEGGHTKITTIEGGVQ